MKIGNTDLSKANYYLIAEIGVNYYDIAEKMNISPIKAAKKMIEKAAGGGVDAVKFQTYQAEKLVSKEAPAYWDTDEESALSQFELFKDYDDLGEPEFKELAQFATKKRGVDFISTPFDREAIDYLEPMVVAYKVASADITNAPLLKYIASKGKPVILSTGASTISEIDRALRTIDEENSRCDVAMLHCTLQYPTDMENANLKMIEHLQKVFPHTVIGYSDHVKPDGCMITLLNSYIKGAKIIEKHFTLDKSLEGNDHYHAMDPKDIRIFIKNLQVLEKTNGNRYKQPIKEEREARKFARRSIVADKNLKKGEELTRGNTSIKRPGTGIQPQNREKVLGKKLVEDVQKDKTIKWKHLS